MASRRGVVAVRHPDGCAINTQYRQSTPTVGVKLLMSMTSHNGIEQALERGHTQSVTRLHQSC